MNLSARELTRYSRNILLNGVGTKGQTSLKNSVVSILGLGGLGSPAALYLSAAGVGEIRLIDSDTVDLTNLQRQILYKTSSQGNPKTEEALSALQPLNEEIRLVPHNLRVTKENIHSILDGSDLILEGSDNFETKFLINDYAVLNKIPLVLGGILRFEGQVMGISSPHTPCYRCTFPEIPDSSTIPNCAEAGVLGSVAGVVGSLLATEALKFLIFGSSELFGKILVCDFYSMDLRKISRKKNRTCPLCGENPKWRDLGHHGLHSGECGV
jgi:molybdopterin-synthase adenylyltransferase